MYDLTDIRFGTNIEKCFEYSVAFFNTAIRRIINYINFCLKMKLLEWRSFLLFVIRLYCYAQKHVKSIRAVTKLPDTSMAKSFRSKSSRNKPPKPQTKTKPTSPYHVSDHKAAITVGVIMGVFLICWVPFFCVNIVAAYCKTCISLRAFQVLLCIFITTIFFD